MPVPEFAGTARGSAPGQNVRIWHIGANWAKQEFYDWLRIVLPDDGTYPPGYQHYAYKDQDFYRGLSRSSYYLEDAATEFQVQGLELDWVCVTWDGDFRFNGSGWNYHDFRGDKWCDIANSDKRNYLRNAYRVLLTRARQGMVVFVPTGEPSDRTRSPLYYDLTFNYLADLGIPVLK